jgi:hypothetical protein
VTFRTSDLPGSALRCRNFRNSDRREQANIFGRSRARFASLWSRRTVGNVMWNVALGRILMRNDRIVLAAVSASFVLAAGLTPATAQKGSPSKSGISGPGISGAAISGGGLLGTGGAAMGTRGPSMPGAGISGTGLGMGNSRPPVQVIQRPITGPRPELGYSAGKPALGNKKGVRRAGSDPVCTETGDSGMGCGGTGDG